MDYKSRAVRALVDLHDHEMRRFLDTWDVYVKSGAPMPEAHGDASYESRDTLVTHVVRASRNYLTWIGECVKRPVKDVDMETEPAKIAPRHRAFALSVLEAWPRHLSALEDSEIQPTLYKTRWGEFFAVETMLEHAVCHPMRHRLQLERLMR